LGVLIDLIASVALFLAFLIALDCIGLPSTSQTIFDREIKLYSDRRVGQSFIAEAAGLHRVDLLLARHGPNPHPVLFRLQEDQGSADDVVAIEISASVLEDVSSVIRRPNTYQSFTFPPITDSSGKRFFFYVESPLSTREQPLLVRYQSRNVYLEGERYVNGMEDAGDLAFKVYYDGSLLATSDLLLSRLTEGKPFPLSEKAFYIIAFFVYLFLFARFVRWVHSLLLNPHR
jgi:hypothetical protein